MTTIAKFVLKYRLILIILFLLLTFGAMSFLPRLYIDNSLYALTNANSPEIKFYDKMNAHFGSNLMILLAFKSDDIFTYEMLSKIDELTEALKEVQNVERVTSLTDVLHIESRDDDIIIDQLIPEIPESQAELEKLKQKALASSALRNNLISEDGTTTAILVVIESHTGDDAYRREAVKAVRATCERLAPDIHFYVAGAPVVAEQLEIHSKRDTVLLTVLTALINTLLLFIIFRNVRGILLPQLIVIMSLSWSIGLLAMFHKPITAATTLMPALIVVIALSDSIHMLTQYYEDVEKHGQRRRSLVSMIHRVGLPCLFTSMTTAVGFGSLLISELTPVKDFGTFASCGIIFAYIISLVMVPAILSYMKLPTGKSTHIRSGTWTFEILEWIVNLNIKHPGKIIIISFSICIFVAFGINFLILETALVDFLKDDNVMMQAVHFLEKNLTGTEYIDIVIDGGERDAFKSPDLLRRVDMIEQFVASQPEALKVISFADVIRRMHKAMLSGDYEKGMLPESRQLIAQYLLLLNPDDFENIIDSDLRMTRISARVKLVGSKDQAALIKRIREFIAANNLDEGVTIRFTGLVSLNAHFTSYLVRSQLESISIAVICIFGMMLLLIRSVKLCVIAMVPNMMPVVMTLGLMGWIGVPLNVVTVMMASIALGIAVDDTIHYLARYRIEFAVDGDPAESMHRTMQSTGRAIVFTSVVLATGFLASIFSSFKPPFQFGMLNVFAITIALLSDIFLYPCLIYWLEKKGWLH